MTRRGPGQLELALLDALWEQGPATAHAVRERLPEESRSSYNTVLTVLRRMESKGMLRRSKVSRSHVYEAVVEREAMRRNLVRDLLAKLFDGSPRDLVAHLVEQGDLTRADLRRLEEIVGKRRAGKGRRPRGE